MPISRKALCIVYGLIALLALIGTWGNVLGYLELGLLDANIRFWEETLVNPASRFITVDIFYLGLAVFVWMVLEARRLGMRYLGLYLAASALVAISVAVPVFLIHREMALAQKDGSATGGTMTRLDMVLLVIIALVLTAYAVLALSR